MVEYQYFMGTAQEQRLPSTMVHFGKNYSNVTFFTENGRFFKKIVRRKNFVEFKRNERVCMKGLINKISKYR